MKSAPTRESAIARAACFAAFVCGCGAAPDGDVAQRRAALLASLVNPANDYSALRIANYAIADAGWEIVPEWNPAVEAVAAWELDAPGGAATDRFVGTPATSSWDAAAEAGDEAALLALGEAAFFAYPAQLSVDIPLALGSRAAASEYGLWVDEARGAGGVVRVQLADGTIGLSLTCASCHAAAGSPGDGIIVGLGNARLDLGRLAIDAAAADGQGREALPFAATWGPGRIDVTTADGSEPVRLADLRPVAWLSHLHADATVAQIDRASLEIRIETLLITASEGAVRPPRVVARALAAFVWSLAAALPDPAPLTAAASRGAQVLAAQCATCHAPPAFTGPPVAIDVVGTDPTVGRSRDRGTGAYRVPSLRGVGARPQLLHDASLPSLDALLDPARVDPTYAGGIRPGAVPGHRYGLDLTESDRADLLEYLKGL